MSGIKGGGAVVLVAAAPAAGALAGGAFLCRGVVRLSRAAYDKVYEETEKAVRKEMQKIEHKVTNALKVTGSTDISHLYKTPSYDLIQTALETEKDKIKDTESIISFFTEEKTIRKTYENDKGLRDDMTQEIERQIEEYRKKKIKQENALKAKEEEIRKLRKLDADVKKKELINYLSNIHNICNAIEKYYPDLVVKARKKLEKIQIEKNNLDTFVRNNQLKEKIEFIKTSSIKENLDRLILIRERYECNQIIKLLEVSKKAKFIKTFETKRGKAENNRLNESDIKELEDIFSQDLKEAELLDNRKRFDETKKKIIKALRKKGYNKIKPRKTEGYLHLEGTGEGDRKATVSIILPETKDETLPYIQTVINQEKYSKQEEWIKEGEELAKEIQSFGVIVDFEEMMTHFNGALLENATELIKKEAGYENIDVEIVNGKHIKINGIKLLWDEGDKPVRIFSIWKQLKQIIEEFKKEAPGKDIDIELVDNSYLSINGAKIPWNVESGPRDIISRYKQTMQMPAKTEGKKKLKEGI